MPENATDADGNVLNLRWENRLILPRYATTAFRYEKDTKKLSPVTGDNYKIIIYRGTDEETGEPDNDYDTEGWKWIEVSGQELPIIGENNGKRYQLCSDSSGER